MKRKGAVQVLCLEHTNVTKLLTTGPLWKKSLIS